MSLTSKPDALSATNTWDEGVSKSSEDVEGSFCRLSLRTAVNDILEQQEMWARKEVLS